MLPVVVPFRGRYPAVPLVSGPRPAGGVTYCAPRGGRGTHGDFRPCNTLLALAVSGIVALP